MTHKDYDPLRRWGCIFAGFLYCTGAAALVLLILTLCGCTRTSYVPVERIRTEFTDNDSSGLLDVVRSLTERLYQKERQVDSLMQSHNERLVLNDNGDTLRHDRETVIYRSSSREKDLERLLESKNDSIRELRQKMESIKTDSVPVPYPVERELSRWEQFKMDFGGIATGCVAVAVCIAVIWLARSMRR